MTPVAENIARNRLCPFAIGLGACHIYCRGSFCLAWKSGTNTKIMVSHQNSPEKEYGWDPNLYPEKKNDYKVRYVTEEIGYCERIGKC